MQRTGAVNLSMTERVQRALDEMAKRAGMSRSRFVEQLVREAAHRRDLCGVFDLGCPTLEHRSAPKGKAVRS